MKDSCSPSQSWATRFQGLFCAVGLAITCVLFGFQADGQLMQVEGYAHLNLLLITEQTVICYKRVSGETNDEVFAFESNGKTVRWRKKADRVSSEALADHGGLSFYMFAHDFLQKRDLRTGQILWETRLDTIPEQKTAPKLKLADYWQMLLIKLNLTPTPLPVTLPRFPSSPPNYYSYELVIGESSLTVFRTAMNSSGCIMTSCFNDWLAFNSRTGGKVSGGSGHLVARSGSSAVLCDQSGVALIDRGLRKELSTPVSINGAAFFGPFRSRGSEQQYSWQGRCIFENTVGGLEQIYLFEASKPSLKFFEVPTMPLFQVNWILLDHHVLRYSESPAYSADGLLAEVSPWFELYDLTGKFIARHDLKWKPGKHWSFRVLGTSAKGKVVFENSDQIFEVEIPSLKIIAPPPAPPVLPAGQLEYSYNSTHMVRGSDRVYEILGDTTLRKMNQDRFPYQLRLRVIDLENGTLVWEHLEPVVIQKIKSL